MVFKHFCSDPDQKTNVPCGPIQQWTCSATLCHTSSLAFRLCCAAHSPWWQDKLSWCVVMYVWSWNYLKVQKKVLIGASFLFDNRNRDGFFKENPLIAWITKMVRWIGNAPCHVSCLPVVCVSGKLGWVPVVVDAERREAVAVCWVGTTAPWSSWQRFSALPTHPSAGTAAPCPVCPPCWQWSWPLVHQGLLLHVRNAWPLVVLALPSSHQLLSCEKQPHTSALT